METVVFREHVLTDFEGYEMGMIIQERVGVLLLVIFLGQVYWKQIYGGLLTTVIGIFFGSLTITAISKMGFKGILFMVIGMFPHMCFYGMAYGILICYWLDDKRGRWSKTKTVGVLAFLIAGIVSEVYVNSLLMKIL